MRKRIILMVVILAGALFISSCVTVRGRRVRRYKRYVPPVVIVKPYRKRYIVPYQRRYIVPYNRRYTYPKRRYYYKKRWW